MAHLTLGVLDGDDIGLEIVPASVRVARAAAARTGLDIDWRPMPIGRRALDTHGSTMPDGTLEALAAMDGFVLGPIGLLGPRGRRWVGRRFGTDTVFLDFDTAARQRYERRAQTAQGVLDTGQ